MAATDRTPGSLVCFIDADWDREHASDGVSRYGVYMSTHAELFEPWDDQVGGITADLGEFAVAAFRVATGPIMSPGYVRWHPRVLAHQVGYGENRDPTRLMVEVTLATALPLRLGSPWWGWTRGRLLPEQDWLEPDEDRHAALASLRLRWPLEAATLPYPTVAALAGQLNVQEAKASVAALVAAINATAGPVLAWLEQGRQGGEAR
jgi:hypothetical protein